MSGEASAKRDPFGLAGALLDGRFRVEREVAEGGFGVVYFATQVVLDRPVAIKVLKSPPGFDEAARVQFRDRFASEAKTIARIRHPHIVDVYDFGVSQMPAGEIAPWMALEWLEGETLEHALATRRGQGGQKPADVLATFRPILQAFAFAHRQGIAHRDIKPANIMVVPGEHGDTLRVLDFGIAKLVNPEESAGSGHTRTSSMPAFSPLYAAPEQIAFGRTGPWTDVHALGLLLTELLTDVPPYQAEDLQIFEQIIAPERPTPGSKGVRVGAWEPVLRKALALSPGERWRNATELLAALETNLNQLEENAVIKLSVNDPGSGGRAAAGMEVRPGSTMLLPDFQPPTAQRPPAPARTRSRLWMAGLTAVLLAGGVAAAVLRAGPAPRAPAPQQQQPGPALASPAPAPSPAVVPPPVKEVAAPAQSSAPDEPAGQPVRISIRTEPRDAALTIDGREVHNPYSAKIPRSRQPHDIVATAPGSGEAREILAFDRDRALVLKVGAPSPRPRRSAAEVATSPLAPDQPGAPVTGYHGSNLKIETEFP